VLHLDLAKKSRLQQFEEEREILAAAPQPSAEIGVSADGKVTQDTEQVWDRTTFRVKLPIVPICIELPRNGPNHKVYRCHREITATDDAVLHKNWHLHYPRPEPEAYLHSGDDESDSDPHSNPEEEDESSTKTHANRSSLYARLPPPPKPPRVYPFGARCPDALTAEARRSEQMGFKSKSFLAEKRKKMPKPGTAEFNQVALQPGGNARIFTFITKELIRRGRVYTIKRIKNTIGAEYDFPLAEGEAIYSFDDSSSWTPAATAPTSKWDSDEEDEPWKAKAQEKTALKADSMEQASKRQSNKYLEDEVEAEAQSNSQDESDEQDEISVLDDMGIETEDRNDVDAFDFPDAELSDSELPTVASSMHASSELPVQFSPKAKQLQDTENKSVASSAAPKAEPEAQQHEITTPARSTTASISASEKGGKDERVVEQPVRERQKRADAAESRGGTQTDPLPTAGKQMSNQGVVAKPTKVSKPDDKKDNPTASTSAIKVTSAKPKESSKPTKADDAKAQTKPKTSPTEIASSLQVTTATATPKKTASGHASSLSDTLSKPITLPHPVREQHIGFADRFADDDEFFGDGEVKGGGRGREQQALKLLEAAAAAVQRQQLQKKYSSADNRASNDLQESDDFEVVPAEPVGLEAQRLKRFDDDDDDDDDFAEFKAASVTLDNESARVNIWNKMASRKFEANNVEKLGSAEEMQKKRVQKAAKALSEFGDIDAFVGVRRRPTSKKQWSASWMAEESDDD